MAAPSTWQTFLSAIRAQESGGNYEQNSAGCLGAYCWNNLESWTRMAMATGHGQYADQNPATLPPQIQDAVASESMAAIYHQTGSLMAAAEWWNGGVAHSVPNPGLPAQPWAPHCAGGTSQAYACQVLTRMKLGGHFLAGSGGPSSPSGSASGGTVQTSSVKECLIGFGGIPGTSWINDIFAQGGNIGQFCVLTRPQARAIIAVVIMAAGGLIALPGLFLVMAAVAMPARGPVAKAAEGAGAMVALVPGLEGVGAAVAVGGAKATRSAGETKNRRQAARQARRDREQPAEVESSEDAGAAA